MKSSPRIEGVGSSAFRVLVLSSYYRHKNLEIINDVIDLIRKRGIEDMRFTMTLPAQDFEETILPENRALIDNVGPQSPEDCPGTVSAVRCAVSRLRCWSVFRRTTWKRWRCNDPSLLRISALRDRYARMQQLYFEPLSAGDALEKILALRTDAPLYRVLVKAGQAQLQRFGTPQQRAQAYLSLCEKLAGRKAAAEADALRTPDLPQSKIVILNQAANYLTIGLANAFNQRFDQVALITGSVHVQGEELDPDIEVTRINRWHERPARKKALSFLVALLRMWFLLMTKYRRYEVFFVSVPPMGYLLNLLLPHRFSMVIWDVYPDILKITGMPESHPVYRTWSALNRRSFRKAWRVFTISDSMADTLSRYMDRERLIVQPIWSIFQENSRIPSDRNPFIREHDLEDRFVVQYSGNIGVTHNVEALIDIAERLNDEPGVVFQVIGRGPRQPLIERLITERNLNNVQMLPFQSDEMFPYSLSAADLGVVILHESVSRGSVPSKAYNLMSFGIPALYIAAPDSGLARYCERYGHARCFSADQLGDAASFIRDLAEDKALHQAMQQRAEQAATYFRRSNADRFVDGYLAPRETAP